MYATQAFQQYQTMQAQTADRGELVVMLYQGAIKFLSRASSAMKEDSMQEAHNNIVRAQDIIAELMGSLDLDAGEIARNLFRIYDYMHYRLVEANVQKDVQAISEIVELLRDLLPAWQYAAREVRANRSNEQSSVVSSLGPVA